MNSPSLQYFKLIANITHSFLSLLSLEIPLLAYPRHIHLLFLDFYYLQSCLSRLSIPFFTTMSSPLLRPICSPVLMTFLLGVMHVGSLWCMREWLAEINWPRINRRRTYKFITMKKGGNLGDGKQKLRIYWTIPRNLYGTFSIAKGEIRELRQFWGLRNAY